MKTSLIILPLYWLQAPLLQTPWNIVKWIFGKNNVNHQVVNNDTLKVFYPKGSFSPSKNPQGGIGFFASPLSVFMSEEVLFQYEVFFNHTFNPVFGGKLPGLFLGSGIRKQNMKGASGGDHSNKTASVRMAWRTEIENGIIGEAYVYLPKQEQIQDYYTIPNLVQNAKYGDSLWRGLFVFKKSYWNIIRIRLKVNSIGKADGELEINVNGQNVIFNRFIWRKNGDVLINAILFETFFGGSTEKYATPVDTWVYFRNVSIQSLR